MQAKRIHIASKRRMRSSMGGCVEKSEAMVPPLRGLTIYICAEAGLTFMGRWAL